MRIQTSYRQFTRNPGSFTQKLKDSARPRPGGASNGRDSGGAFHGIHRGMLVVLIAILVPMAASGITDQAFATQITEPQLGQIDAVPGPEVADWLDDIIDDLIDILSHVESVVDNQSGPLPPEDRAVVADHLTFALSTIAQLFDTGQPGYIDPDAGEIDMAINPQTLPEYAQKATNLAKAVQAEVRIGSNFDQDYVATKLKTIEHLITREAPHNYRTLAGIE